MSNFDDVVREAFSIDSILAEHLGRELDRRFEDAVLNGNAPKSNGKPIEQNPYPDKTLEELGLADWNRIEGDQSRRSMPTVLLWKNIYTPEQNCPGFEFACVEKVTSGGFDSTYIYLFHGTTYWDGVKHLYFGHPETDNYGYLYCVDVPSLVACLKTLDDLQAEHCPQVRRERETTT